MTTLHPRCLSALVLSTALAGCGGSSTTVTFIDPPADNGLPFATNQIVETSTLVGPVISANASRLAFVSGTVLSAGTSPVTLKVVNSQTIQLTTDGQTWTLVLTSDQNSQGDSIWIAQDGISGNPSNLSATFGQTDLSVPDSPRSIFFGNIQELPGVLPATTLAGNIFTVTGFETDPAEISALSATVSYQGEALITSSITSSGSPKLLMNGGTMTVNVDYAGSNTVSGSLQGTASGFGGGNLVIDLAPTSIAAGDNSFSTTFSKSSSSTSSDVISISGNLSGTLYGADAAEMGILLDGTAQTTSDASVDAAGYGLGIKQ